MNQKGIALLLALVVMTALAAVSLTAFALARAESTAGRAELGRVQARAAAEGALALGWLGWHNGSTPLAPGAQLVLGSYRAPGSAVAVSRVRSLGGPIFALEASGTALLGSIRLSQLVVLGIPDSFAVVHPMPYPRGRRVAP